MKKPAHHLIAEVPRKRAKVELTIGIDLGDVWSHYCTLNQQGEVIDRGRFRTTPKAIDKWFDDFARRVMPDVQWLEDFLRLRRFERQIQSSRSAEDEPDTDEDA